MDKAYYISFRINLLHNYYEGVSEDIDDIVIVPSQACQKLLNKYNLLLRYAKNSAFIIFASKPIPAPPEPVIPIPENTVFDFLLKFKDPVFYNYTQLDGGGELPSFKHDVKMFYSSDTFTLEDGYPLLTQNVKNYGETYRSEQNVAGLIEVVYHKSLFENIIGSPLTGVLHAVNNNVDFKIRLDNKAIFWKYYIVASKDLSDFTFAMTNKTGGFTLNSTADPDTNKQLLTDQYKTILIFTSSAPVPLVSRPKYEIELKMEKPGSLKIFEKLPIPSRNTLYPDIYILINT